MRRRLYCLLINVRQETCLHITSRLEHYDFWCTKHHILRYSQNSQNLKSPKIETDLKEMGPEYVYWI